MDKKHITAYTDGSAIGNPGPAGWAVAFEGGRSYHWRVPELTNNAAELYAAWMAAELAPPGSHLEIATDSKLVIGWLAKGWRISHVHIAELIVSFWTAVRFNDLDVSFRKVKGHAGSELNEYVDAISRAEAREMAQERWGH